MANYDDDTAQYTPAEVNSFRDLDKLDPVEAQAFDEAGIEIGAITHRGKVRKTNEDQFAVLRRTRSATILASSLAPETLPGGEQHAWLLAVTDGLGGEVAGEVASETAIRSILSFANGLSSWIMRPSEVDRHEIAERVDLYVQRIQQDLKQQAEQQPDLAGMSTTLTAVYVYGSDAVVVNVGDSRSYLIRAQEVYQVTRDHTVAQEMLDEGHSEDTVRPYRNVLTRCFSTDGLPINVDLFHIKLVAGDQFLLCTDGLTDMVPDETIKEIATSGESVKDNCEGLVTEALSNGGRDNITLVLARVQAQGMS